MRGQARGVLRVYVVGFCRPLGIAGDPDVFAKLRGVETQLEAYLSILESRSTTGCRTHTKLDKLESQAAPYMAMSVQQQVNCALQPLP